MNKIEVIKKRIRLFKKLIAVEQKKLDRLKYKSRRLRHNNPYGPRQNWYTDRMQELQHVVRLLEGKDKPNEFVHHLLDDELGSMLTGVSDKFGVPK